MDQLAKLRERFRVTPLIATPGLSVNLYSLQSDQKLVMLTVAEYQPDTGMTSRKPLATIFVSAREGGLIMTSNRGHRDLVPIHAEDHTIHAALKKIELGCADAALAA